MIHLIPVTPADEPFLFTLYAATRQEEIAPWGWTEAQAAAFLTMQFQAQSRAYAGQFPEADHRLILDGDRPIGRILVARLPEEIRLVDIALLPECRSSGIGTRLLQGLQAEAGEADLPVRLSVIETNPARHLYERLGFAPTALNVPYLSMEWRPA